MSHSNLYKRIKSISGQSANSFIRFIRLRKAAEILLTTDSTVYETAYKVGLKRSEVFQGAVFQAVSALTLQIISRNTASRSTITTTSTAMY
jgi:AraC-like DNA-binding protein